MLRYLKVYLLVEQHTSPKIVSTFLLIWQLLKHKHIIMGNAIINHKSLLPIKRALSFHFSLKDWNKSTTIRESTLESIPVSVLALLFLV